MMISFQMAILMFLKDCCCLEIFPTLDHKGDFPSSLASLRVFQQSYHVCEGCIQLFSTCFVINRLAGMSAIVIVFLSQSQCQKLLFAWPNCGWCPPFLLWGEKTISLQLLALTINDPVSIFIPPPVLPALFQILCHVYNKSALLIFLLLLTRQPGILFAEFFRSFFFFL